MGRLDPKADRKQGIFIIKNISVEDGFNPLDKSFITGLITSLSKLAQFNDCLKLEIEHAELPKLKTVIQENLKNFS